MILDWTEHPDARQEFLEAHERYLGIDDGRLGDEFTDAAEAAAELILQWPDAPPPSGDRRHEPVVRTWHLGKFPYQLVYVVQAGQMASHRRIAWQGGGRFAARSGWGTRANWLGVTTGRRRVPGLR